MTQEKTVPATEEGVQDDIHFQLARVFPAGFEIDGQPAVLLKGFEIVTSPKERGSSFCRPAFLSDGTPETTGRNVEIIVPVSEGSQLKPGFSYAARNRMGDTDNFGALEAQNCMIPKLSLTVRGYEVEQADDSGSRMPRSLYMIGYVNDGPLYGNTVKVDIPDFEIERYFGLGLPPEKSNVVFTNIMPKGLSKKADFNIGDLTGVGYTLPTVPLISAAVLIRSY